jgi:hypothetical protein
MIYEYRIYRDTGYRINGINRVWEGGCRVLGIGYRGFKV